MSRAPYEQSRTNVSAIVFSRFGTNDLARRATNFRSPKTCKGLWKARATPRALHIYGLCRSLETNLENICFLLVYNIFGAPRLHARAHTRPRILPIFALLIYLFRQTDNSLTFHCTRLAIYERVCLACYCARERALFIFSFLRQLKISRRPRGGFVSIADMLLRGGLIPPNLCLLDSITLR